MKRLLILMFLLLALLPLQPGPVAAYQGVNFISSEATVSFPYSITFDLEAQSASEVADVYIECRVQRRNLVPQSYRSVVAFEGTQRVEAGWTWNMLATGGVPVGTEIEYRWIVKDVYGQEFESAPAKVSYDDSRYDWRSLTDGRITLYWYQGDLSFAQQLMDAADEALSRLSAEFGISLEQETSFYIYASAWDLQGALVFPQEWTGGVAFPTYNTIMIGISPDSMDWGIRAVAHELGHLVVHQLVFGPFAWLPTWLDEGIAMNAEGALSDSFRNRLDRAISNNTLFSVRSLASTFPADADGAYLSYAQSYSVVRFLIDNYGSEKFTELLEVFGQGSTGDDALMRVYGFDTDGLDDNWRAGLGLGPRPAVTPSPPPKEGAVALGAPYIALIAIVIALSVLSLYLGFSTVRRWRS